MRPVTFLMFKFVLMHNNSRHQLKQKHITCILQRCKGENQLNQVHAHMTTTGTIRHPPTASKLVSSFALSRLAGTTRTARLIANEVKGLDTYTFNTIMRGFLEENDPTSALLVYSYVNAIGLKADSYTFLFAVKACGVKPLIRQGEQVHCQLYKLGFLSELIIPTALITMYASFRRISCVQNVFDEMPQRDTVMWNSLMAAYIRLDEASYVFTALNEMIKRHKKLNQTSVVSLLSACSMLRNSRTGTMVHGYVIRNFSEIDLFVYNSLIEMYLGCKSLSKARTVFQIMPLRNVVSWTSMMNGLGENNYLREALALFRDMESANVKPDEITMLSIVSTCSKLGSFELGRSIAKFIVNNNFEKASVAMTNALIDMHAKCGNIRKACEMFDNMEAKTIVSWTTIIHGLALHGYGIPALIRFSQMQREGFEPDSVVFLNLLFACSHAGLVDEGRKCFDLMINEYGIKPWMEHYGCLVDLLCRAQLLDDALEFILNMPIKPDTIVWRTLLKACQSQGNVPLASRAMAHLECRTIGSEDYLALSNLYASMAEWIGVDEIRKKMKDAGTIKQNPGISSIDLVDEKSSGYLSVELVT